jgi:hypothetical protein
MLSAASVYCNEKLGSENFNVCARVLIAKSVLQSRMLSATSVLQSRVQNATSCVAE